MSSSAIEVHDLRMSYGAVEAVRGIDLDLGTGEVFGFLGPNGAGKTTTIEMLEGYRSRIAGDVSVLGVDPAFATREWRDRLGLVLQSCELDPLLTVRETLSLFAGFYTHPRPVDEIVELVGQADKRDARIGRLSGGQRRRADVGVALLGDPELVVLDEPTTTLGMAVTAYTPTVDAASSVGPFTAVILPFVSGMFIPVSSLPSWFSQLGQVFPLVPLADGMQRAVTGVGGGTGVTKHDVVLLAVWGGVGLFVAARKFRWVPQGVGT